MVARPSAIKEVPIEGPIALVRILVKYEFEMKSTVGTVALTESHNGWRLRRHKAS